MYMYYNVLVKQFRQLGTLDALTSDIFLICLNLNLNLNYVILNFVFVFVFGYGERGMALLDVYDVHRLRLCLRPRLQRRALDLTET